MQKAERGQFTTMWFTAVQEDAPGHGSCDVPTCTADRDTVQRDFFDKGTEHNEVNHESRNHT